MLRNVFNYQNINNNKVLQSDDGMVTSITNSDYNYIGIHFRKESVILNRYIDLSCPFSWVVYFSIDDEDNNKNNLEKAWNLVVDMINNYDIKFAVVSKKGQPLHKINDALRGRQIAIYLNDLSFLQTLLNEITEKFVENNISPSYRATDVKEIKGSSYFTYSPVIYKRPDNNYMSNMQQMSQYISSSYDFTNNIDPIPAFNLLLTQKMFVETMQLSHPIMASIFINSDAEGLHFNFQGDVIGIMDIFNKCDMENNLDKRDKLIANIPSAPSPARKTM